MTGDALAVGVLAVAPGLGERGRVVGLGGLALLGGVLQLGCRLRGLTLDAGAHRMLAVDGLEGSLVGLLLGGALLGGGVLGLGGVIGLLAGDGDRGDGQDRSQDRSTDGDHLLQLGFLLMTAPSGRSIGGFRAATARPAFRQGLFRRVGRVRGAGGASYRPSVQRRRWTNRQCRSPPGWSRSGREPIRSCRSSRSGRARCSRCRASCRSARRRGRAAAGVRAGVPGGGRGAVAGAGRGRRHRSRAVAAVRARAGVAAGVAGCRRCRAGTPSPRPEPPQPRRRHFRARPAATGATT